MNIIYCTTGRELDCARLVAARYEAPCVVPLTPKAVVHRRTKVITMTESPAIPGVVFAVLPRTDWRSLLALCYGRRLATVGGELAKVDDNELDRFVARVATGAYANRLTRALIRVQGLIGKEVIVPSGLFAGQRVTVLSIEGTFCKCRLGFNGTAAEHLIPINFLVESKIMKRDDYVELTGLRFKLDADTDQPTNEPEDDRSVKVATVKLGNGAPQFGLTSGTGPTIERSGNSPTGRGHQGMPQYQRPL